MSVLTKQQAPKSNQHNVTSIDVNARIDYVLRFSKQAILVIDEDKEVCSKVCHQFLASLNDDHNAAFLSISSKLNDIQVRCRIVEQLFSNTLFDPEHSLTKTIIQLAKPDPKIISIVIENAEYLSLQLLHELSQLAVIAQKLKQTINIVLTGNKNAAMLAANNTTLFNHELIILSAESGQLLPLNSKAFKKTSSLLTLTLGKKIFGAITLFSILLVAVLYGVSDLTLNYFTEQTFKQESAKVEESQTTWAVTELTAKTVLDESSENKLKTKFKAVSTASSADILGALEQSNQNADIPAQIVEKNIPATANDILSALSASQGINKPLNNETNDSTSEGIKAKNSTALKQMRFHNINPDYYLANAEGFVIQISAYVEQEALDQFLLSNRDNVFYAYHRLYNHKPLLVLTTEVIPTRDLAVSTKQALQKSLKLDNLFIKSVNTVNSEINLFQSSQ